ncbi:Uu.00g057050.m01.CDS01 [Anthostomella pinea]|uniref:Uu.00g057050.m01.CDS01 n=1 Tax=Anthostomella pinea TaxID=933095 RepID=A0AAI8VL28_9PEZI|nr:Uu.00g057050.m01.CDS01 [Anthostomella pinea]
MTQPFHYFRMMNGVKVSQVAYVDSRRYQVQPAPELLPAPVMYSTVELGYEMPSAGSIDPFTPSDTGTTPTQDNWGQPPQLTPWPQTPATRCPSVCIQPLIDRQTGWIPIGRGRRSIAGSCYPYFPASLPDQDVISHNSSRLAAVKMHNDVPLSSRTRAGDEDWLEFSSAGNGTYLSMVLAVGLIAMLTVKIIFTSLLFVGTLPIPLLPSHLLLPPSHRSTLEHATSILNFACESTHVSFFDIRTLTMTPKAKLSGDNGIYGVPAILGIVLKDPKSAGT